MAEETGGMEEECEDAVFEVCDARERYPKKCASELAQCLRLTTRINMAPIKLNPPESLPSISITEEQRDLFNEIIEQTKLRNENSKIHKKDLESMLMRTKELVRVLEQLKDQEDCTVDKILKKNEGNKLDEIIED